MPKYKQFTVVLDIDPGVLDAITKYRNVEIEDIICSVQVEVAEIEDALAEATDKFIRHWKLSERVEHSISVVSVFAGHHEDLVKQVL